MCTLVAGHAILPFTVTGCTGCISWLFAMPSWSPGPPFQRVVHIGSARCLYGFPLPLFTPLGFCTLQNPNISLPCVPHPIMGSDILDWLDLERPATSKPHYALKAPQLSTINNTSCQ